jgi:hypothetical protein
VSWRIAVIDSCGSWPGALEAAAFVSAAGVIERCPAAPDPTGHGSRVVELLEARSVELLLAQVFTSTTPASAAAVAEALAWVLERGANLVHMSLGLPADRAVLREAVARAVEAGAIIVASTPARGKPVYPAAYAGVIRATGDARCAPGELSCLGPAHFGGYARFPSEVSRGGASAGAAWVTKALLEMPSLMNSDQAAQALQARASYFGAERVTHAARVPAPL